MKSILFGSQDGQRAERAIDESYNAKIMRESNVYEIIQHKVKPDKTEEYVDLVCDSLPLIASDTASKLKLIGAWKTEIGNLDTFTYIWEYMGYHGYHDALSALNSNPTMTTYKENLYKLIVDRRSDLVEEFSFWKTASPRDLGGIFELRTYDLKPGHLLEWKSHWMKGLECRRQVMEPVGAWFSQLVCAVFENSNYDTDIFFQGQLNRVYHLWQFSDLCNRKMSREKCW